MDVVVDVIIGELVCCSFVPPVDAKGVELLVVTGVCVNRLLVVVIGCGELVTGCWLVIGPGVSDDALGLVCSP